MHPQCACSRVLCAAASWGSRRKKTWVRPTSRKGEDGSADIVTVGGVFTVGHVAPTALGVMASLVRSGGLLVVSTRRTYLEQTNFREVVGTLVGDGTLRLLIHFEDAPYTMDSTGDYWAFQVN